MERKLKWNAVGLENKAILILDDLKRIKSKLDPAHSFKIKKVQGIIDEFLNIVETIERIKNNVIPTLEKKFKLTFKTPELIFLALSRGGIRTTFENLESYYKSQNLQPIKHTDLVELAFSGETGNVLALIGDSAIKLALVETFWDSTLSTVGQLTAAKASIESNKNIARLCDELDLYNNKIDRVNQPTKLDAKQKAIEHEKGTLVEAILGVVYLEFGFEELVRLMPLLQ